MLYEPYLYLMDMLIIPSSDSYPISTIAKDTALPVNIALFCSDLAPRGISGDAPHPGQGQLAKKSYKSILEDFCVPYESMRLESINDIISIHELFKKSLPLYVPIHLDYYECLANVDRSKVFGVLGSVENLQIMDSVLPEHYISVF